VQSANEDSVKSGLLKPKIDQHTDDPDPSPGAPSLLKVGLLAAVSALAGGLAAAWYYRKTLARLRQADVIEPEENANSADDMMDEP
jgi:hypothetical protein